MAKAKAKAKKKAKPVKKSKPAKKTAPKRVAAKKPAKKPAKKSPPAPPPAIVAVAPTAVPVPVPVAAAPAAPAAPKAPKAKKAPKPQTIEQQRRDLLDQKSVDELKKMLKANEQITTGSKGELVKRILDGIEHGALPRCPQCGLGRIKLSKWSSGGFYCPGGYDDDEYQACDYKVSAEEIERPPWKLETPGGLI